MLFIVVIVYILLSGCCSITASSLSAAILPPFLAWHSGAIPYSVLLVFQIVIIVILAGIVRRFNNGNVMLSYQWGKVMLLFGGLYFIAMLFRLIAGPTFASDSD